MGLPAFNADATSSTNPAEEQKQQHAVQGATGAGADTGAGVTRPKTEEEKEADRLYEERMEEEYAKREGGA